MGTPPPQKKQNKTKHTYIAFYVYNYIFKRFPTHWSVVTSVVNYYCGLTIKGHIFRIYSTAFFFDEIEEEDPNW